MGETLNSAIGQGHTLTTPLQLATMTARLVNGGVAVKPILVRSIEEKGNQIPEWESLGLNVEHLRIVQRGMAAVVNGERGTAYGSRITEPGMQMGGKTGTAQVRRITAAMRAQGIQNKDLPWKFRHHALFVGYAPVDKPRYVTAVVVEHGVGGSSAAAPIARDILLATLRRDPRKIHTVDAAVDEANREAGKKAPAPAKASKKKKKGKRG